MTQQNNRSILQATYTVETSKEKKTELWSAAVSWTGAGKKYVDVVAKKGKLTIKNPKTTSIKCKVQHALQVNLKASLCPEIIRDLRHHCMFRVRLR